MRGINQTGKEIVTFHEHKKCVAKNIYGLSVNNILSFTLDLFWSLNNFYFLFLNDWKMPFWCVLYLASCSSFIYQFYNVAVNNNLIIHVGTTGLSAIKYLFYAMFHRQKDGYAKGHFTGLTVYDTD